MSIAIATQGKFIPATGGGSIKTITRIVDRGTSVGWEMGSQKKPKVVVNRIDYKKDEKDRPKVLVTTVEEI